MRFATSLRRPAVAVAAAVLFRYPVILFLLDAASLRPGVPLFANEHSIFCSWDCNFYQALAQNLHPHAFFPAFPLATKLILALTGLSPVVGTVVSSWIFTVLAGAATLYLGDALWKTKFRPILGFSAEAWALLAAVSFFPHSEAWVRGYSEGLFFLILALCALAFVKKRPLVASSLGGLLAVSRPQGIWITGIIAGFFGYEALKGRPGLSQTNRQRLGGLALLAAPFLVFMAWNYSQTGDALAFLSIQRQSWDRKFYFWTGLMSHIPKFEDAHALLYLGLAAGIFYLRRPTAIEKWLGVLSLVIADLTIFFGGFYSYLRYESINLGLFCLAVEVFRRSKPWYFVWLGWCLVKLGVATYHAGFGLWTG